MKNTLPIFRSLTLLLFVFSTSIVNAQNPSLRDFVIFAGNQNCPNVTAQTGPADDCGVQLGTQVTIESGRVGSYNSIIAGNSLNANGHLHAFSSVNLGQQNTIVGNLYAANNGLATSAIVSTAIGYNQVGNINAAGSVQIAGGSIVGTITLPQGFVYNGPTPTGGVIQANPIIPTLPTLPAPTVFPASAGQTVISSSQVLNPGSYGILGLNGQDTITFNGPGIYVFHSIENLGSINYFKYDFQNTTSGLIEIYVHNNIRMGQLRALYENGGNASRIYCETHGDGVGNAGFAFTLSNSGSAFGTATLWSGTVYAPNSRIRIASGAGNGKFYGALYSGTRVIVEDQSILVHVPLASTCETSFLVDAGADTNITCSNPQITLTGTTTGTGGTAIWTTNNGNIVGSASQYSIDINAPGTYVFTYQVDANCFNADTVRVVFIPCIIPAVEPDSLGRTNNLIGMELLSLSRNGIPSGDSLFDLFFLREDSVFIEVITVFGQYQNTLNLLQTPSYGLTNILSNGNDNIIIVGLFPIANLERLDSLDQIIKYVRPLFPPKTSSGIALTQGDLAIQGNLVRNGFGTAGEGVRIGVLSDSYNTINNGALADVVNGDLPGIGNPNYPKPVHVLQEFPFGRRTDEGRAMLQIIHDIAPASDLAFRTGFISAGDFAQGIIDLKNDNCDVIVDDITYITEPFFEDGRVAQAVNAVTNMGATYFSAAGNYGDKSYGAAFSPTTPTANLQGHAHDFGGGDIFQKITLTPGNYLIVLQWDDPYYSLNPASGGAATDLDIYLTYDNGITLFGFNRNNLGIDPLEVLPFLVTETTTSNIMVVRNAGNAAVNFKYLVFRGDLNIDEYQQNNSTIVGQANAEGAIAIGAVLYSNTPAYGLPIPTPASFSSLGGTPVNGIVRNKPNYCAPNGVNTTVNFGAPNIDGDAFPNFFGTSAAAPHAAAVAALMKSARFKFYGDVLSTQTIKNILDTTSIEMGTPGFDFKTGNGFIQAESAIRAFAVPTPTLDEIILSDSTAIIGAQTITFIVVGSGFSNSTILIFGDDTLATTVISETELQASVDAFNGNPELTAYTPPITPSGLDGGLSNSLYFFNTPRTSVIVSADFKSKKFGERLPELTFTVLIDSVDIQLTNLSLEDLGLDTPFITTTATTQSNTGLYAIQLTNPIDINTTAGAALLTQYDYRFINGLLRIERMPLLIKAQDTTFIYGKKMAFDFEYTYDTSLVDAVDRNVFLSSITSDHQSNIADAVAFVDGLSTVGGRALVNTDLQQVSFLISGRALINGTTLIHARALINEVEEDTTNVIEVALASVFNYQFDSESTTLERARPLVNSKALVSGVSIAYGRALINGVEMVGARALINSSTFEDDTTAQEAVIIDEDDVNAAENDSIDGFKSINLITGIKVGSHLIVPGAFVSENFKVSYMPGTLTITPAELTLTLDTTVLIYGDTIAIDYTITGYQYEDSDSNVLAGEPDFELFDLQNNPIIGTAGVGQYITRGANLPLQLPADYTVFYADGSLEITPRALVVQALTTTVSTNVLTPNYLYSTSGFAYSDSAGYISGPDFSTDPHYIGNEGTYVVTPSNYYFSAAANYNITYLPGILIANAHCNTAATECSISSTVPCSSFITLPDCITQNGTTWLDQNSNVIGLQIGTEHSFSANKRTFTVEATSASKTENQRAVLGNFTKNGGAGMQTKLALCGIRQVGDGLHYDLEITHNTASGYTGPDPVRNEFKNAYPVGAIVTVSLQFYNPTGEAVSITSPCPTNNLGQWVNMYEVGVTIPSNTKTELNNTDELHHELSIYPNPATNVVNIVHGGIQLKTENIRIFDVLGRNLADKVAFADHGTELVIDINALSNGVYMIEVNQDGLHKVFRLIVQ